MCTANNALLVGVLQLVICHPKLVHNEPAPHGWVNTSCGAANSYRGLQSATVKCAKPNPTEDTKTTAIVGKRSLEWIHEQGAGDATSNNKHAVADMWNEPSA